ncbi:hypothetical protein [Arenimonas sp.]|uniref:hypothetical protein n=1 Tax=Arenimonas sp. TaxID=1872635 RepID=UPI0025F7CC84|nr:hypothetical protein [Arenimonas sp.]
MSWSPGQRQLLEAMGYTLYRPAGQEPPAPPPEGPLLRALRRAARRDDLAGLPLPAWEQLRADGAAKRALWHRLRAFRRTH